MADISVTDSLSLTATVAISDDSPLALANLKKLNFSSLPVVGDFNKPIDQFPLDEVEAGAGITEPAALIGKDADILIGGGASACFSLRKPKQECLFEDDQFSPVVPIKNGECWAGLAIKFAVKESANFASSGITQPASGFGVTISAEQEVVLGTLMHFPASGAVLPTFKDGLAALIQNYSIPSTPEKIRATPIGFAHTAEIAGNISLGASYSAPLIVNPLATLGALNFSLNIQPNANASIQGSITLSGSFVVRAYRSAEAKLVFGVYKKRKTSLSASLSATAGIGIDLNSTDLLTKVLNAVIPAPDLSGLQLDDSQRDELRSALKECVDQSISLAANACCTASVTDEAAVVYELELSTGDMSQTDAAIASALRGNWSRFETLSNARPVRNIVRELHERKHKLNINLLGIYNATSIADYLKSTTVLHDEHGQIVVIDKAAAKSLSAGTTPYTAKADKLRTALAQAFVATATYGASKGKLDLTAFTVRQSFLEYHAAASASDVTQEVQLARAVGLALKPAWDSLLTSAGAFNQNKFYLDINYDKAAVMRLFYQDAAKLTSHSSESLDQIGRDARVALLDPAATNSAERRLALNDDRIWSAMSSMGNTATFHQIPELSRLNPTAIAAISADFIDIRWWSNALAGVTPKLTAVLKAIDQAQSPNPLSDPAFMSAHKNLENALAALASNTHDAFGDGWPLAVMYRLAVSTPGPPPSVQMDIGWNGKFEHYASNSTLAAGQTSGN